MDSKDKTITSKSEYIIQNYAGCGPFQAVSFLSVFIVGHLGNAFVQMFMSFGIYNPGWRCLDANSTTNYSSYGHNSSNPLTSRYPAHLGLHNSTTTKSLENATAMLSSSSEYITDNDHCSLFESCHHIEFKPGSSTIVTEWGLLCGKDWIPPLMISLQYAGMVVGATCVGQIGDTIGRKTTLYVAPAMACVVSVVSYFSTSWEMFVVLRFFIGLFISPFVILHYVYVAELFTNRWRGPLANMPYWPLVCMLFGVACMILKDWRHVMIAEAVITGISVLPALWLPESPLWLEVKDKKEKFEKAMKKILKTNGKDLQCFEDAKIDMNKKKDDDDDVKNKEDTSEEDKERAESDGTNYNIKHLFKPEYIKYTFLIAIPWFASSLISYALGFGAKSLSGDFYVNLIVMYAFEIPFAPLTMSLPNLIGRKKSGIVFSGFTGACLLTAACFHQLASGVAQTTGVLVLAIAARISTTAFWGVTMMFTVELYPTVVRGLGTSWGNFMNRLGGVLAPFLIPNDPESFFICYLVMAGIAFLCVGIVTQLPETKGRQLDDTTDKQ